MLHAVTNSREKGSSLVRGGSHLLRLSDKSFGGIRNTPASAEPGGCYEGD